MSAEEEVLQATHDLLAAVATTDYATYEKFSDSTLTCFEPETKGHLVEGLSFHKYYFDLARKANTSSGAPPKQNTIASPHVRLLGDSAAIISYIRVIQSGDSVTTCQETRVWQRGADQTWKNVHFHRSSNM
mmetsp:Transcript_21358/g.53270  ORF Transcript_21358/g.53270 Transcript_21358/m.53270 type:complete len:131 (-) Transcript_21358:690-1082(-)